MKHTGATKALLNQIETTRQSLEHVVRLQDIERVGGLMQVLNALYNELFELARLNEAAKVRALRPLDFRLVFSSAYPDGRVLNQNDYQRLVSTMTADDRATHISVDVDPSMIEAVENETSMNNLPLLAKRAK